MVVGVGVLREQQGELAAWVEGRTVFALTTPRVESLHGESLAPLGQAARRWRLLTVPEGEAAKTMEVASGLWQQMISEGGKRDSRVVAFGGGSVGDLAGFVAGCFLRGVEFLQVPTTLLAQVDAAIGGKTGVDLPEAKNSVGLFYHPSRVVADTSLLHTLSERELRSGLIEVVKMGVLADENLFRRVEDNLESLLKGDGETLAPVVAAAVQAKIEIVEDDPTELGKRSLLNLGHTLGHALETAADYHGLRHGEAVGYGLLFAVRLAERRGLPQATASRLRELVEHFHLPALPQLEASRLIRIMHRDKKTTEDGWRWVLPRRIGECWVETAVEESEIRAELERFLPAPFAA